MATVMNFALGEANELAHAMMARIGRDHGIRTLSIKGLVADRYGLRVRRAPRPTSLDENADDRRDGVDLRPVAIEDLLNRPQVPLDRDGTTQERTATSDLGGTMRLGAQTCFIKDGTLAKSIYGANEISERTLCSNR